MSRVVTNEEKTYVNLHRTVPLSGIGAASELRPVFNTRPSNNNLRRARTIEPNATEIGTFWKCNLKNKI